MMSKFAASVVGLAILAAVPHFVGAQSVDGVSPRTGCTDPVTEAGKELDSVIKSSDDCKTIGDTISWTSNTLGSVDGKSCPGLKAAFGKYQQAQAKATECEHSNNAYGGSCPGTEDYQKATQKAQETCDKIELGQDCTTAFKNCNLTASKIKSAPEDGSIDVDAEEARDKKCPAFATAELDKYKDQLKDLKREKETADAQADKVRSEASRNGNADRDSINNMMRTMNESNKAYRESVNNAQREGREGEQQKLDQVRQLASQIEDIEDKKREASGDETEAMVTFRKNQADIVTNCYKQASEQVAKMQEGVVVKLQTNSYLRGGGFNGLLRNVGITSRQQWERVATKYYNWCMASTLTKKSYESANDILMLSVKRAREKKASAQAHAQMLNQQMLAIEDGKSCASGSASQLCQDRAALAKQLMEAKADHDAEAALNQQQLDQAKAQQGQDQANQTAAQQKADQNSKDIDKRIANLNDYINTKMAYGGGASNKGADVQAALNAFKDKKEKAEFVLTCHAQALKKDPTATCESCTATAQFLVHAGETAEEIKSLDPSVQIESSSRLPAGGSGGTLQEKGGD